MENKLVYVLHKYDDNDSTHFVHVINLLKEISVLGVRVHIIIEKSETVPEIDSELVTVERLTRTGLSRYLELMLKLMSVYRKGYKKVFIRITSVTAIISSLTGKLFDVDSYFWQSGTTLDWDKSKDFNLKKIKWYCKSHWPSVLAKKTCTYFVTGPEPMADYYVEKAGVNRNKVKVLYNDIDTEIFSPSLDTKVNGHIKNKYKISDKKIILSVHRYSPVRLTLSYLPGILDFLKHDKDNKFALVFIGDGEDLKSMKEMVREKALSDKCLFLGAMPNKDIVAFYKASDIFLHATYNEGFPRVIIEAMACGLPIVTTNAGGTESLMTESQKRFVSDVTKPLDLQKSLHRLSCLSEKELNDISIENSRHADRFSTKNIAKMYYNLMFAND